MQILCRMKIIETIGRVSGCALLGLLLLVTSCVPHDRYVTVSGYAQGGTYSVKFNLNGSNGMISQSPEAIKDSIDCILQAIDESLSGYNKNSLVSSFNAGKDIVPDGLFVDMYNLSYKIYLQTDGAVDVAAAPLYDIWGFGFKSGEMPDDALVLATMKNCGMSRLLEDMSEAIASDGVLSPGNLLSEKGTALPALNYNAVAQGYSCDMVAKYLYGLGVRDMMVNIGEIFCDGVNPSGKPWTIGIDTPEDGNNELGASVHAVFQVPSGPHGVVTSGNYRKFYVRDGKKYAHTVDPRTGYPVSHNLLSATVVASDATLADAYATYCMVIGLEASKVFLESTEGIEGCLVYDDDGKFGTWTSSGMQLL